MDRELRKFLGVNDHIDKWDNKKYFGYGKEEVKDCGELGEIRGMAWQALRQIEALAKHLNVEIRKAELGHIPFYAIELKGKNDNPTK